MIIIYKEIIKNNIHKLTKDNLKDFASKNNLTYTKEELDIVYSFIMNNYQDLLNENIQVFESLRPKISNNLYKNLLSLYIDYKQKYL